MATPLVHRGGQLGERVVAAGVGREHPLDVGCSFGVGFNAADFVAVDSLADVEVAGRRETGGAAVFDSLVEAFLDFLGEVLGVELGDAGHDRVQQRARRCVVDGFAARNQLRGLMRSVCKRSVI
jgi:hypothetical protein